MERTTSLRFSNSSENWLCCALFIAINFDKRDITIMTCHGFGMLWCCESQTRPGARKLKPTCGRLQRHQWWSRAQKGKGKSAQKDWAPPERFTYSRKQSMSLSRGRTQVRRACCLHHWKEGCSQKPFVFPCEGYEQGKKQWKSQMHGHLLQRTSKGPTPTNKHVWCGSYLMSVANILHTIEWLRHPVQVQRHKIWVQVFWKWQLMPRLTPACFSHGVKSHGHFLASSSVTGSTVQSRFHKLAEEKTMKQLRSDI